MRHAGRVIDLEAFPPDPARASLLDRRVRALLAESLAAVFDVCEGHLASDRGAQLCLLDALARHRIAPGVFAAYAELVEALAAENLVRAQSLLDTLLCPALALEAAARVVTLDSDLGAEDLPAIYRRVVADDGDRPLRLASMDAPALTQARDLLTQTRLLLERAAPALASEIAEIAHEIVLVDGGSSFGGVTSFYLWGAVTLNAPRIANRTQMAEALAHESGHAYLLGATLGAPLVDNDPAERFASPLRSDPRPMDGIVHAAFVLARMVWCADQLLERGQIDQSETKQVRTELTRNVARFESSRDLISRRARFTDVGAVLWRAASEWMVSRRKRATAE
jgi:hypothetical protein